MGSCAMLSCNNRRKIVNFRGGGISYHRFPADPDLFRKWIATTGRNDWKPKKNSTICSQHFLKSDYIFAAGLQYLKPTAVPLLNIDALVPPGHMQDDPLATTYFEEVTEATPSKPNIHEGTSSEAIKRIQIISPMCSTASLLEKRRLIDAKKDEIIKRQRKKIKALHGQVRRLKLRHNKLIDYIRNTKKVARSCVSSDQTQINRSYKKPTISRRCIK